jgi:hypothetical protein
MAVEFEQAVVRQPLGDFACGPHEVSAKLTLQSRYVDAGVQPQSKKPRLFMLLNSIEPHSLGPRGLSDARPGKILIQVVGGLGTQYGIRAPPLRRLADLLTC